MSVAPDKISGYRIVSELGKGSMGVVYEGEPLGGGKPVAIKLFYPDTKLTPEESSILLERFEREGSALSQLSHENVVGVLEVGTENDLDFIVMEKLEGFNLKDLQTLGTRFTLAETLDVMLQLLAGLSACHRANVIHRDIKPANVVRAPDGTIKLTDFGIARIITDETLSRSGTIVGTPNYMSPEQIRGEEVDPRTDIFSAGVLMYELLAGRKPFDGPDVTAIMYNITNVHPPSPRYYNGALPVEIEEIAYRALAKPREERYPTVDEFAAALRELDQSLRYRDESEVFLNALPAAPDPDAGGGRVLANRADVDALAGSLAGSGAAAAGAPGSAWPSLTAAGGIVAGTVYCIDCGMSNDATSDFCVRCMRPLIRRDILDKLASKKARLMFNVGRGDYLFLTCLSIVIAAMAVLILYLFFKGVT